MTRSRSILMVLATAAIGVITTACPPPPSEPPPGEVERRSFTANVADGIVTPALSSFVALSAALTTTTTQWASAPNDQASRAAAQEAWSAAMQVWQRLEVLQVGPAATPPDFIGGQGLRAGIYAWPVLNLCAVDGQIVQNVFEEPGWAATRLPNQTGLAALEYVLFVGDDTNQCSASNSINTEGSWDAIGSEGITARRAKMAAVLAADVEAKAGTLKAAWAGDAGFAVALRTAGQEGSPFATAQEALDQIYAAMFYIELTTKDRKLAVPAGLHVDCETDVCPELAESRFSQTSVRHIAANLQGIRQVFVGIDDAGADDVGLDDLLRQAGADALVTTMSDKLDAAIAAADAFDGTIEGALITEPERVVALHTAVKAFTDDFKSTMPSTLGLRVPDEGAGDND